MNVGPAYGFILNNSGDCFIFVLIKKNLLILIYTIWIPPYIDDMLL